MEFFKSDPFQGTPTSVDRKDLADSAVTARRTTGTLGGTKLNLDMAFDGRSKQWSEFETVMLMWADSKNFSHMLEGGHGISSIFQAANATAAKIKATGSGTIFLDIDTYKNKEIEEEFKKTSVITSVALAVRGNCKEKFGASWADAQNAD